MSMHVGPCVMHVNRFVLLHSTACESVCLCILMNVTIVQVNAHVLSRYFTCSFVCIYITLCVCACQPMLHHMLQHNCGCIVKHGNDCYCILMLANVCWTVSCF